MRYSEADIRRVVTPAAFSAGSIYKQQGRVTLIDYDPEGLLLTRVTGNESRPYEQSIEFRQGASGTVQIEGDCSCPVAHNCKHVVAALLYTLAGPPAKPSAPATPSAPALAPALRIGQQVERLLNAGTQAAARPDGLRYDLAAWLDELDRARATAEDSYPPGVAQRLVYVLKPLARDGKSPALGVRPISTRLLKSGAFSEGDRLYPIERVLAGAEAKFLRPADVRILGDIGRLRRDYHGGDLSLRHDPENRILGEILATGRARWLGVNGPALEPGEPRPGRIAWQVRDEAEMRPSIETGEGLVVLNALPPVYVDAGMGRIGPVALDVPPKVAAALLDAPAVAAEQVAQFSQAMARRAPDLAHVRPALPRPAEVVEGPPEPCLRLMTVRMPVAAPPNAYYGYGYAIPEEDVALARLSFRYGPVTIGLAEARQSLTRLHDGALIEIRRDMPAEREHLATLLSHGFVPLIEARPGAKGEVARDFLPDGDAVAWFDMIYHDLPELAARGWRIDIAKDFPFQVVRGEGGIDAEVQEGSGIDWFELDLGMVIDGERIDLIGPIVALLSTPDFDPASLRPSGEAGEEAEPFYLPLGGGRFLAMPAARLAPIVAALQDLFAGGGDGDGRLRLKAVDAAGLAALEDATAGANVAWRGGERLRAMGRTLTAAGGIPAVTPPPTFHAALRPYQAEGVSWLAFLREVGFGGVLADDMGLGKTVQTLAFITIEKAEGRLDRPVLIVAPTSLMVNWRREAERFAPDLRVLTLQGLDRKSRFGEIPSSDVVLTTYPLIARDHEVLGAQPWHLLILDEAQTIKNPDATTTKLVLGLEARHRFCLSGTPLENHLGELWSLFSFAVPGLLGDRHGFTRHWRTPIEKQGSPTRSQALARRVKPFMLRRTKEEVATDLPPKTEIIERIEFQSGQRDIYESIRLSMHQRVRDAIAQKGFNRSRIVILDALLKLRQACCDPRLLKLTAKAIGKAGSAKLERLEEMLGELHAENRRILVFSQFTSMLDLIRPRLDARHIPYSLLTGDTRDRETEVRRFQDGKTPVFLVSLKAGGTGLNLTAADTVILYDPWWNPAVEEQAIDRAHRIGQDKPVFVHKLVATGTIEEKMEVLKQKKRALAESLFDHDGAPTLDMTESDLDMLFAAD